MTIFLSWENTVDQNVVIILSDNLVSNDVYIQDKFNVLFME